MNRKNIEQIIQKFQFTDYKWIKPDQITIAQWVRMKCLYGCGDVGKPACPPHVPSIEACRALIHEYNEIVIFRFEIIMTYREYRKDWAKALNRQLLDLEREVFLSGCHKAFLLNVSSCNLCHECKAEKKPCKHPESLRPCPEALGIDVFATARAVDYPIEVLRRDSKGMNRYAILLIQ